MKYIKTVLGALFATVLLATSTFAADSAAKPTGQWTLSLDGSGAVTTTTPSTFNGGLELSLGHTGELILPLEVGVRQGVGYSNGEGDNWALNTKLYSDWTLIKLGNLEFDAGINGGVAYGNQPLAWSFAPEAIARLWLLKDVNTFVRAEFPFDVTSNKVEYRNAIGLFLGLQARF